MHRDNSPFIQLKTWRPLGSAEMWGGRKKKKSNCDSTRSLALSSPRRARGETRRLRAPNSAVTRCCCCARTRVSAQWKARGGTKWRGDVMDGASVLEHGCRTRAVTTGTH
ncbi:unnamed protein product [Pleuronectes platessa]|uniref:Uncharacterized protein n=1 Tax=Pleuronectes platessa TaxID=8262 RepID=A0A9N7VNS9_PLEPL|nr:unnamed protein product [Pleuronectes platessa]